MTITRAREITRQFSHNFVATMRLEETAEYKSVVDDAIEWAKTNEPSLFYGIVHDYLIFLTDTLTAASVPHANIGNRSLVPATTVTARIAPTSLTVTAHAQAGKRGWRSDNHTDQYPDIYCRSHSICADIRPDT